MRELIALECKKNNLKKILLVGAAASGFIFVYICMGLVFGKVGHANYESLLSQIIASNKIVFTLFVALLISRMFGEEISTKSFSILFTYPISRFKLLLTKVVLIIIVVCPMMFISMLAHFILLMIVNGVFKFVPGSLSGGMVVAYILVGLIQSICTTIAAFIPLAVDVRYTSSQYTLIAAGVMAFFLYGMTGRYLISFELVLMLIYAAAGGVVVKWSLSQITRKDIM